MTSISKLRQIVTDMHTVFPQGARKAARAELAEKINKPGNVHDLISSRLAFSNPDILGYWGSKRPFKKESVSSYLSKIYDKEQNMLINKTIKNFGVEIKNEIHYEILQGIAVSKKAGLKLPKNVIVKNLEGHLGLFYDSELKNIYIHPTNDKFCLTVIHETAHKNDMAAFIVNCIPVFNDISDFIGGKLISSFNKKLISQEICEYATKNRNEFIACTAHKLLSEGKQWTDLDPKIKRLYKLFLGPKLNLGQNKPSKVTSLQGLESIV